jgi:hypothetical protein
MALIMALGRDISGQDEPNLEDFLKYSLFFV